MIIKTKPRYNSAHVNGLTLETFIFTQLEILKKR